MNFEMVLTYLKGSKKRAYRYNWNGIKFPGRPRGYDKDKQLESIKNSNDVVYQTFAKAHIEHTEKMIEDDKKSFPQMFIYMEHAKVIPSEQVREPQKTWLDGKDMHISNHINLKTIEGNIVPWFPSQEDILSDDWVILD